MQQGEKMTLVNAIVANDGRLVVTIEWPDGQFRVLDREEAVLLGLTTLNMAGRLFDTVAEFSQSVEHARGKIESLHPCSTLQ
jgi:hypothetical protein